MKYSLSIAIIFATLSTALSQKVSPTKIKYDEIFYEISNKGKWGLDDKLGTINYINSDKLLSALKIPSKGISVSLSFDISQDSSQINLSKFDQVTQYAHEPLSIEHNGYDWALDEYKIAYHGFTVSHMDGLGHLSQDKKLYNGYDQLGIENYNEGIISRGILIDIPLLHNKNFLKAGTVVTIDDILEFEKKYGVKIQKGDIVLIRTGRWNQKRTKGDWDASSLAAGLNYDVPLLLSEREVAVLGSDGTNDVQPSPIPEEGSPIHKLTLVAMGMPLLDNLNLEDIAKESIRQNSWEFLLCIQPLRFKRGTGSPVNVVAIF
jgi:kynurenine formamidase